MRQARLSLWILLIFAWAGGSAAQAPKVDLAHAGATNPRQFDAWHLGSQFPLGPDWLFSPDDDPAFASPGYDDIGWKTVSIDRPIESYAPGNVRHVWYRLHIDKPDLTPAIKAHALTIEMQFIYGGYELYFNGVRIGAGGKMDSRYQSQEYLAPFDVPAGAAAPDRDSVIAIRIAVNRTGPDGVGTGTPFKPGSVILAVGDEGQHDAIYVAAHENFVLVILALLALVAGLVALALYLAMRNRVEYLAIAVTLLALSAQSTAVAWSHLQVLNEQNQFFQTLFLGINVVAGAEFVRLLLHLRRSRWLLALEIAVFLGYFEPNLADLGLWTGGPGLAGLAGYFLPALVLATVLPVLLFRGLRRGNRDARVILPVVGVSSIANYWNFLGTIRSAFHLPLHIPGLPSVQIGSYGMYFWEIYWAIYIVTILIFLVLRTVGIARESARVAAELEAARTVQQVLIPEEIPSIPGFALASVYKPAGQVGGDFFQIVPTKNGGTLAVIGDVSGKGMPAAMTVSLLVGTFRTLAHFTQSPAEILAAMNTRMLARSQGGFTTCLVLRADPDGKVAVANAGHIPPYVGGMELSLESGLPLGLDAKSSYVESIFQLEAGQQLTLVTDGVVEARDKNGALFGFARTAGLSAQPAEAIVEAAQAFGQQDDITALTLTFAPAEVLRA